MKIEKTVRGFEYVALPPYPHGGEPARLVQQSSAIGNYPDSLDMPGSSYLWVGKDHHLDRAEVKELAGLLQNWLRTGRLSG